jgi:AAA ATPase domain
VDLDRAETIVKELLSPKYLNSPQLMVFRAAWQGQSYRDLATTAGYDPNYIKGVGAQVWRLLSTATNCNVTKANFRQILESFAAAENALISIPTVSAQTTAPSQLGIDWGEVIDVSVFYGRESERTQLYQWIVADRCQLVAILGMGGMGKTTILIEILRRFQLKLDPQVPADPDRFSQIVWRSLLNAPPLKELLTELIQTLVSPPVETPDQHPHGRSLLPGETGRASPTSPSLPGKFHQFKLELIPKTVDGQIELLLEFCQQHRCLIVLDNGESIFQAGAHVGQYRSGYADYGDLFSTLGQMQHQSCLVLTSREQPTEISKLVGVNPKVRTLVLPGLDHPAGQQIFADRGCLPVTPNAWAQIDRYCGGNPLALQLIAATVWEVADGDFREILPSLQSNQLGFADIQLLLAQQWERLTIEEQQVLYWLAISRETRSILELEELLRSELNHQQLGHDQSAGKSQGAGDNSSLVTVLQSLQRRSIIFARSPENDDSQQNWSLPPMIIEYVISKFADRLYPK